MLNEALLSFVLFVLVAFGLIAVDASVYLAVAEPTLFVLTIPLTANSPSRASEPSEAGR